MNTSISRLLLWTALSLVGAPAGAAGIDNARFEV
jgi:hypothetical protein